MPYREEAPIPAKNERGMEITKAQGQETTKKLNARYTQTDHSLVITLGRIARAKAIHTTMGV